jgi:hypothetical protein
MEDAVTGTAIKTNGVGFRTTSHLNLTISLADAWKMKPLPPKETKPAKIGRPPGPREASRIPYAGKEPYRHQRIRLRNKNGEWLHMSVECTTLVRADSWIGTHSQLKRLRRRFPIAREFSSVAERAL